MRVSGALSVVFCAVSVAAACGSFGEGDSGTPRPDASTVVDAGEGGGGGSDSGTRDASCRGGRDAGNTCGAETCTRGQACCLEATRKCASANGGCNTTQVNCASPNECDGNLVCCQVEGTTVGTRCMQGCSFGAPLCEKDDDCKSSEFCREPDPTRMIAYWHCAACPL